MKRSVASKALHYLGSLLVGPPSSIAAGIPEHFYFVAGDRPPPPGGIQSADNQRRALTVDAIRRRMTMHVAVWTSIACVGLALAFCLIAALAKPAPLSPMSPTPTLNIRGY